MIRVLLSLLAAAVVLGGCGALRNIHAEANQVPEGEDFFGTGPDALVDRLGEPDEWDNRKDGDRLLMTATWICVEDEYREVTWQSRVGDDGTQYWAVVSDVSRGCDEAE